MRRRRSVFAVLAGCLPALAQPTVARAAVPVLVVEGRGWGHGVGMAQDGAYWMGRAGTAAPDILRHFYPGTRLGRSGGMLRVGVFDAPGRAVVLDFPGGGEVRDGESGPAAAGFPVSVGPGGSVRVSFDGSRYHAGTGSGPVRPAVRAASVPARPPSPVAAAAGAAAAEGPTTTTTAPSLLNLLPKPAPLPPLTAPPLPRPAPAAAPPTTAPEATSARSLWAVPRSGSTTGVPGQGLRYRGTLEVGAAGAGLHLVNHIDVESGPAAA
ncbi:MAG: hypothetical protein LC792_16630, partial [Actinobacteria bacterium]|nr:hypothetical protein [Actinomycetota bacterium]